MHQRSKTIAAPIALIVSCGQPALADRGADFNGDGFDDLVVGAPRESTESLGHTGAVHIIYGTTSGLSADGSQIWTQDSPGIDDASESTDYFGSALTWGDFNGDGFDDLAIGAPQERYGPTMQLTYPGVGAVHVLYGSAAGLTAIGSQLFMLGISGIPGGPMSWCGFGQSLAAGDFDADGRAELVIVASQAQGIGPDFGYGLAYVLHGSDTGLETINVQVWHADVDGLQGESHEQIQVQGWEDLVDINEHWGAALQVGDFNEDGFEDLAVSVAHNIEHGVAGGAVNILYGSPGGLTIAANQMFDQASPGIPNVPENLDGFGEALAVGDFNGDGFDDLAIGAPYEGTASVSEHGVVHVLFGGPNGLSSSNNQYLFQGALGIQGAREHFDRFGFALQAADFDADGFDELAIAAPSESTSSGEYCGIVHLLHGSPAGLKVSGNQVLRRGHPRAADWFGFAMGSGDYDGDGRTDLTVGVPRAEVGGYENAGLVLVFYGRPEGLRKTCDESWHQNTPGIDDVVEAHDQFGSTL